MIWTGRDLNPRPPPCQGGDLPADLPALVYVYSCIHKSFYEIGDKINDLLYFQQ